MQMFIFLFKVVYFVEWNFKDISVRLHHEIRVREQFGKGRLQETKQHWLQMCFSPVIHSISELSTCGKLAIGLANGGPILSKQLPLDCDKGCGGWRASSTSQQKSKKMFLNKRHPQRNGHSQTTKSATLADDQSFLFPFH